MMSLAPSPAAVFVVVGEYLRRYHRHEVVSADPPNGPALFVANHGFGGIVDLNVLATLAAVRQTNGDRRLIVLTHQVAWTLRVGSFLEPLGARPARRDSALRALAGGDHVLVFPGGDIDAGKPFVRRNRVVFDGRRGFAALALEAAVPIVPVVTAGAGESLFVVSDGRRLARATRVDRLLRLKALPVSISIPWGVNVGVVGLVPYLPLPTKLRTVVMPSMYAAADEDSHAFGDRVEQTMQQRLDVLVSKRELLLG